MADDRTRAESLRLRLDWLSTARMRPAHLTAYSLADAYAVMSGNVGSFSEDIPKSNAAARRVLELDATLARPHAASRRQRDVLRLGFRRRGG